MKARKPCRWPGCRKPRAQGCAGKYCERHALASKRESKRVWRRKDRARAERVATSSRECSGHDLAMRLISGKY